MKRSMRIQSTSVSVAKKSRRMLELLLSAVLLMGIGLVGCAGSSQQKRASNPEIEKVMRVFTDAVEKREVTQMASVLHKDSLQYAWFKKSLMKIPQKVYLGLLKSGKIGGVKRALAIHSVDVTGNLAAVKASLTDSKMRLEYYFTLMKLDGQWQIMSNVMHLQPRG